MLFEMSAKHRSTWFCSRFSIKRLMVCLSILPIIWLFCGIFELFNEMGHINGDESQIKLNVQNKSLGSITIQVTAPRNVEALLAFILHYEKCPCIHTIQVLVKSENLDYDVKGALAPKVKMKNLPNIETFKYTQYPTEFVTEGATKITYI